MEPSKGDMEVHLSTVTFKACSMDTSANGMQRLEGYHDGAFPSSFRYKLPADLSQSLTRPSAIIFCQKSAPNAFRKMKRKLLRAKIKLDVIKLTMFCSDSDIDSMIR